MGSVKLNEDAIVASLYENRVRFEQYQTQEGDLIDPAKMEAQEYSDALVDRLGQIAGDVTAEASNSKVFRAVVRAIGSSNRKWKAFLKKESQLKEALGGYSPSVAVDAESQALLKFFPGRSGGMHVEKVLEWARILDVGENYYKSLLNLGEHFQDLAGGELTHQEQMICILTQLSVGPIKRWDGPTLAKWPGMRYAIGAEFMRNLGWDGFKPDRHIIRLFDAWVRPVVDAQKDRAVELVKLTGRRAESAITLAQYSLTGLAITPPGGSASKADNLLWLLGSEIVRSGDEEKVDKWTYFVEK